MSSNVSKDAKRFFINFAIAGVSAAVAKSLTAPIDRIKLILQNQDSAIQVLSGERTRYNGILDCLRRIPVEQGFRSLWRGNGVSIIRYFPMQALNFSFFDLFTKSYRSIIQPDSEFKSALVLFLAGGTAGGCTICLIYPIDLCQTRIAVDIGGGGEVKREFTGLRDCVKKIGRTDGASGLYRGFGLGAVGVTFYRAIYFGMFAYGKTVLAKYYGPDYRPPIFLGMCMAQASSVSAGLLVYPFDTISRRMMLDSGRAKELRLFKSPAHAAQVLYSQGGMRALYKGALVNTIRGMCGALVLVLYDEIMHRIDWNKWLS